MQDLKKYALLVVDDEEMVRETIVFDFKRRGFTVFSASNGEEAFKIAQENRIDLVLSDIRMPDGNGLALLRKLRAIDPNLPVLIFMTGFSDVDEAECLAQGAKKVIAKPFDRKALLATILDALGATEK